MNLFGRRFSDLKILPKLFILNFLALIFFSVLALLSAFFHKSDKALAILINQERIYSDMISKGIEEFYLFPIDGNEQHRQKSIEYLGKANQITYYFSTIDSLAETMHRQQLSKQLFSYFPEGFDNDITKADFFARQIKRIQIFGNKQLGQSQIAASENFKAGEILLASIANFKRENTISEFPPIQEEIAKVHQSGYHFSSILSGYLAYINRLYIIIMVGIAVLLGFTIFLISFRISRSISYPLKHLSGVFKSIAGGNLKIKANIQSSDEIGEMAVAFNQIHDRLEEIIEYSKKVAEGDYHVKIDWNSEDDQMAEALNRMAGRLEELKSSEQREKWLKDGLASLDDEMRGNFTVRELSGRIVNFMNRFVGSAIGALYAFDNIPGHLELTGINGAVPGQAKPILQIGEGLAGQAAAGHNLEIINTGGKYHKLYSASGEFIPQFVYLLPLYQNNELQGVIELATLEPLGELPTTFLKISAERIAANLKAAIARFRHNELLEKTQEQAEKLQEKQEELRQIIQEMEVVQEGLNQSLAENQQMQEKLARQKALLDSMLNTLPDYIYFKDAESKFLRVSQSMVKLFGTQSDEELIGKTDFDFHSPENAKKYFEEEQEIIQTKKGIVNVIRQGVDENKNVIWTSVTKLPMFDDTGKCIGTFGISKDITQIKNLEVEVKKQNEQLAWEKSLMDAMLNNIPDSIYFKDTKSRFLKVSKSLSKKFNFSNPEQLAGLTDFDIHDSAHARQAFDDEQNILKTQRPIIGFVEQENHKDGVHYTLSTKMPFFGPEGELLGTFGISKDITQLKTLELEIKGQNDKLKAQQEELRGKNEALLIQQEELKTANEELTTQEEELKVANEELAEQTKVLTENEKKLQVQQEELRVSNEELEARTKELELQKKQIINKNNELLKAQNNLQHKARELELASQYKSEFLANMSHELRTPLNSLLILSKILASNKNGNLTEEQQKAANIIYKSGNDLLMQINEILDLSKIEAGKMNIELETVSTDDIKDEILTSFKPVAEEKKLNLEVYLQSGFPESLHTDRQRILQIIRNLLSNAFKFTGNGGIRVTFGLPGTEVVLNRKNISPRDMFFISVADTGVGIPQNKLEAIFEAFQQADGSISRKFGGTGLGLSISKQLSRLLEGEIHVYSKEGEGSIFTVYLPLHRDKIKKDVIFPQEEKIDPDKVPDALPETEIPFFIEDDRDKVKTGPAILIIHPEKNTAKKLLAQCHKRKFRAVVADSVKNGIILAEKFSPNAIILPAGSNNSINFSQLKENQYTNTIPVHLISKIEDAAFDNLGETATAASVISPATLPKPQNQEDLQFNKVLLVEDDPSTREAVQMLLANEDIIIREAVTAQEAYEQIKTESFGCIILDLGLPDYSGKELLEKLNDENIPIPHVIIHTAKELSEKEFRELQKLSGSIVVKGLKSDERLMDEVSLFLHSLSSTLPAGQEHETNILRDDTDFSGKKILIVDDDIRNIFSLAQILEEKGIEIVEAENGKAALEILKETPGIDLILMDIMMPEMDGYKAMEEIRKIESLADIPIITVTAKAMKDDFQKAISHGANDYIAKPVEEAKLLSLLKIWLFK